MTVSIAVVCEARADRDTAAALADRVILAHTWVDDAIIDHQRAYRGLRAKAEDTHLTWKRVRSLADEHNVSAVGFFNGEPGLTDAFIARLALLLLIRAGDPVSAIVLIRDSDDDPDRRDGQGLRQARDAVQPLTPAPIIIGVAHPKRECWILAGFEPAEDERPRLDSLRQRLGYNPCEHSDRLTAEASKGVHNAKLVLAELSGDDRDREARCLTHTSLDTLRQRGHDNGLAAFLGELEQRLIPLFGVAPPHTP